MARYLVFIVALALAGCAPRKGADKALMGSGLGTGMGAGVGAVVGNQVGNAAHGAGIGAGLGLVSGLANGLMYDSIEKKLIEQKGSLAALKYRNIQNSKRLARLQSSLDRALSSKVFGGMYQVFFDVDVTSLRPGSVANLQAIADAIKESPYGYVVYVYGHTDDSGDPKYNERLAEARARTVAGYLAARGVSTDRIRVKGFGATRPIASNATETGRQLNRRVDIFISTR